VGTASAQISTPNTIIMAPDTDAQGTNSARRYQSTCSSLDSTKPGRLMEKFDMKRMMQF
jgi:hypothetical protein